MSTPKLHSALNIVLAVDGSEHSLAAAQLVRDLPLPPGSRVTALAVLSARQTPGQAALLAALDQVRTILQDTPTTVESVLLHGHPAEELTKFADKHRPDLMAIGAKGLRATLGILLGGVVQQVVEYALWPVLVVRAPYAGLHHVLMVTDGSPHSQRAVDYLTRFPFPPSARVSVMHVLPPLLQPELQFPIRPFGAEMIPPQTLDEVAQAAARQAEIEEQEGQAILAQTIEKLKAAGIEAASVLRRGDAATEIIEYVKGQGIDLVVAGSRGLSQVRGWLLGSVSRKLVHYAGCSVLIVKGG